MQKALNSFFHPNSSKAELVHKLVKKKSLYTNTQTETATMYTSRGKAKDWKVDKIHQSSATAVAKTSCSRAD
jgi:hypothetical protein